MSTLKRLHAAHMVRFAAYADPHIFCADEAGKNIIGSGNRAG